MHLCLLRPTYPTCSRGFPSRLTRGLDRCEANHYYILLTHATNVASRTTYTLAEDSGPVLQNAPSGVKQAILAIRDLDPELHEQTNTVHGI